MFLYSAKRSNVLSVGDPIFPPECQYNLQTQGGLEKPQFELALEPVASHTQSVEVATLIEYSKCFSSALIAIQEPFPKFTYHNGAVNFLNTPGQFQDTFGDDSVYLPPWLQRSANELAPYYFNIFSNPIPEASALLDFRLKVPPVVELTPVALVLHVEGYDYGRLRDLKVLSPPGFISLGTTLYTEQLPKELQGRLILINHGDGYYSSRNESERLITRYHELLHAVFNAGFRRADLPSSQWLDESLRDVQNGNVTFQETAQLLGQRMQELSRSEIISYTATGEYNIPDSSLYFHWWQNFHLQVENTASQMQLSNSEQEDLRATFRAEERIHEKNVRSFQRFAEQTFSGDSGFPLTTREQCVALLMQVSCEESIAFCGA